MNIKHFLISLGILLVFSSATARELTLNEAMELALGHSHKIKADRSQAEAFRAGLDAAVAERMPTLSASGVASYRNKVAQLEVELPTGDVFSRDVGLKENYQVDLRLGLPVYTGGRIGGGVELARASSDYHDAMARATTDNITLMARVEFLSLYKAERLVEAAQAGLLRATTTLQDVQSLYDAGAADSINILDAQLAASEAETRVQSAVSFRRQSEINLSILLGLDPSESITPNFAPVSPTDIGPGEHGIDSAKPELRAASAAVAMSRSMVKLSRADMLPSVSLFGGYSWGKPNLDQFHDEFNDYFMVGATASWSFNLGGKPVKMTRKSGRQLTAAEFEYARTREQLDHNARVVLEKLKLALANYRSALERHRIASDNYRLAHEKHRQGVLSANRLIEIETALSQAEASLASNQADFYIVQSQYYQATGSSLLKEGL